MSQDFPVSLTLDEEWVGLRLDAALARLFPEYSRMDLKRWIEAGWVLSSSDSKLKPASKVWGGMHLEIAPKLSPAAAVLSTDENPTELTLNVVTEHSDWLVLNKAAGVVCHPGAGHTGVTLVEALAAQRPSLAALPRAGLVHRLDKDTTGLLLVAKHLKSYHHLVRLLQERQIERYYHALVYGHPPPTGTIEKPMGRSLKQRTRMCVRASGRHARTDYRVLRSLRDHSLLELKLHTGRTHQIRVHLQSIGYPIVGDPSYSSLRLPSQASPTVVGALRGFKRQALHAHLLRIPQEDAASYVECCAPYPEDFRQILSVLSES